jgi:hypothetical protein
MHGSSTGAGHAVDVSGGVGSGAGQPVLVVVAAPPVEPPGIGAEHAIIPSSGVAIAIISENENLQGNRKRKVWAFLVNQSWVQTPVCIGVGG